MTREEVVQALTSEPSFPKQVDLKDGKTYCVLSPTQWTTSSRSFLAIAEPTGKIHYLPFADIVSVEPVSA